MASPNRVLTESTKKAALIAGALPAGAAAIALLFGLSTPVTANGSWTLSAVVAALGGVAAIGLLFGGPVWALVRAFGVSNGSGVKTLYVILLILVYLGAAAASIVLGLLVSLTRDPPEC